MLQVTSSKSSTFSMIRYLNLRRFRRSSVILRQEHDLTYASSPALTLLDTKRSYKRNVCSTPGENSENTTTWAPSEYMQTQVMLNAPERTSHDCCVCSCVWDFTQKEKKKKSQNGHLTNSLSERRSQVCQSKPPAGDGWGCKTWDQSLHESYEKYYDWNESVGNFTVRAPEFLYFIQ